MNLDIIEEPTPEDRAAIVAPLVAYNEAHGPAAVIRPVAILLRDDAGDAIGGLWGKTMFDWLYVELLAVPESLRGQGAGAALIRAAEDLAIARGCIGSWLDTFAFQARPFYEKLDYSVFGQIDDHPRNSARYFLMKRFANRL
ncbi:GNAT family N-acetyltransferase [Luteibacter anthropi]|uniref:GNAT family N-acetyltransferase n=1 Tax=Luteibacter anthropi TaxID=564369 RepID=UPI0020322940|nr:GNAT family N-acetyltransferase [Luteibacter anthropi]URX63616.1 GNAT family N-acetyltransferase [Luteibacter anthropi]